MTQYSTGPLGFDDLKTVSIHERGGMVRLEHFARPHTAGASVSALIDSLPRILAANSLRAVIDRLVEAREKQRAIIWGLGGHVIKCGLAPVLTQLMEHGYATAFAMNGAASIHDYEIAIAGWTSEDVESVLPDGRFGSAEETGREMNAAIVEGVGQGIGMGESLSFAAAGARHAESSLLAQAARTKTPVTVHVAIGTDTPHTFPQADGAAIGAATHTDFRLFCSLVRGLHEGGVYVNLGSAVLLPEVFLKAVSVVRNLGYPLQGFTTVNFDFLQHYRPLTNVVKRPHAGSSGQGYSITGHHEIMVPLLAAALLERSAP